MPRAGKLPPCVGAFIVQAPRTHLHAGFDPVAKGLGGIAMEDEAVVQGVASAFPRYEMHLTSGRIAHGKRTSDSSFRTPGQPDRPDEKAEYGLQIFRVDLPSYDAIDGLTLLLFRLAREFDGEYGGWETVVLKPSRAQCRDPEENRR